MGSRLTLKKGRGLSRFEPFTAPRREAEAASSGRTMAEAQSERNRRAEALGTAAGGWRHGERQDASPMEGNWSPRHGPGTTSRPVQGTV